jgi:hypothetical protein
MQWNEVNRGSAMERLVQGQFAGGFFVIFSIQKTLCYGIAPAKPCNGTAVGFT